MTDLASHQEAWIERYRDRVGRGRHELETPALLLDLDVARRNIAAMAEKFVELPTVLRPHIKVHKSVELARLEVAAGAIGVACATTWETLAMVDGGIEDVLVANQIVQDKQVDLLASRACQHRITIAVDDERNVERLAAAARAHGSTLELVIEIDVGMGRCGVRSDDEALRLAERIATLDGVAFRGMQGYEGHCMLEPDAEARAAKVRRANETLVATATFLGDRGHVSEIVTAGGTGTYALTGSYPGITEVQAGSYSLMDDFHGRLIPGDFEVALTVLSTVVSRHDRTVVLDAGRKSVSTEFGPPPLLANPGGRPRLYAEEHALVDFDEAPPVDLGDRVEIVTGYAPTTVNLYDVFHVVENDVVTDVWPVSARGPGRPRSIVTAAAADGTV